MLSVRKGLKSSPTTFQCPRFLPDLDLSRNPESEGWKTYYGYYVRSKDKGLKLRRIRRECVTPKYFDPTVIKFLFIIQIQSRPGEGTMGKKKENRNPSHKSIPEPEKEREKPTTSIERTIHIPYDGCSILRNSKNPLNSSSTSNKVTSNKNTFSSITKNNPQPSTESNIQIPANITNSFVPLESLIKSKDGQQPKKQHNNSAESLIQVGGSLLRVNKLTTKPVVLPKSQVIILNDKRHTNIQAQICQSVESQPNNKSSQFIYKDVTSDLESDIEILEPSGNEIEQNLELEQVIEDNKNGIFQDGGGETSVEFLDDDLDYFDSNNYEDYQSQSGSTAAVTIDLDSMAEWNDLDRDFVTEEMEDDDFGVEGAGVEDPDYCLSRDINSARKRLTSKQNRSLSSMHRMKRDMMNMNEKARRQQLSLQFQDVLNMIPQGFLPKKVVRGEKAAVSKFESLNIFKKFVLYLTNKEAKLAAEKVELRRKNERLQMALQQRLQIKRLQMKMATQQEGTTIPLG